LTGGAISPNLPKKTSAISLKYFLCQYRRMCQYRRICQYRQIFLRFISQITCWASWMTSFSGLTYLNLVLSTFIWLPLVELLILPILVIKLMRIHCKTPYKIQKLFDICRHFECLRVNFCSLIAECANIAKIFRQKTFGDIGPPVLCFWKQGVNLNKW
jgi:hypothetical protein